MSLAIVIGSEGQGMSRLVSDKCDFTLKYLWLDMLIVSMLVAASLMMYEVFRKRDETERCHEGKISNYRWL